jgi:hypothetical protein
MKILPDDFLRARFFRANVTSQSGNAKSGIDRVALYHTRFATVKVFLLWRFPAFRSREGGYLAPRYPRAALAVKGPLSAPTIVKAPAVARVAHSNFTLRTQEVMETHLWGR